MTKEALLVIPGFDSKEVGLAMNRTVDSISNQQSIADITKFPLQKTRPCSVWKSRFVILEQRSS
jgi:hypothetical protein